MILYDNTTTKKNIKKKNSNKIHSIIILIVVYYNNDTNNYTVHHILLLASLLHLFAPSYLDSLSSLSASLLALNTLIDNRHPPVPIIIIYSKYILFTTLSLVGNNIYFLLSS